MPRQGLEESFLGRGIGNSSFGHGDIAHSHSQRPVLRVFPLDQPIRYFYFKLTEW